MKKAAKNWLEWIIFAGSALLIAATAGVLLYEYCSLEASPPDPQVTLGQPQVHTGYFAVPVTVLNRGDCTAESVQLAVQLKLPGGETEQGEFQLQYLPRRATRHAWVTFLHDPREGKLEARVLGYEKP